MQKQLNTDYKYRDSRSFYNEVHSTSESEQPLPAAINFILCLVLFFTSLEIFSWV